MESKSKGSGNMILESWYTILSHAINKFECVVLENTRTSDLFLRSEVIKSVPSSAKEGPTRSTRTRTTKTRRTNKPFNQNLIYFYKFIHHRQCGSHPSLYTLLADVCYVGLKIHKRKKVDMQWHPKLYIAKEKNGKNINNNNTSLDGFWLIDWLITW